MSDDTLADVIYDSWENWTAEGTKTDYCEQIAAAIQTAVNRGRIAPIVPEGLARYEEAKP